MTYADCIRTQLEGLQKNVGLTKGESDKLLDEYDRLLIQYSGTMSDSQAASKAAADFVKIKAKEIRVKNNNNKRYVIEQQKMIKEIDERLDNYREFYGDLNKYQRAVFRKPETYMTTLVQDKLEEAFVRHGSLRNRYYYMLADVAEKNMARFGGLKNADGNMRAVVRALVDGADTDAQSSQFAKDIRRVMDLAHKNFEASGGLIGRIDNYFPQRVHNMDKISKVDLATWKSNLWNRLDRQKMIDEDTGLPITDEKLDGLLDQMYTEVTGIGTTRAADAARQGAQRGSTGGDVSMRRNKARFLYFKSADDFMEYNREFGYGDESLFDMVLSHLDGMARDTAVLQKLGPKPNAMMNNLTNLMESSGLRTTYTKGMYQILTGSNAQPITNSMWYRVLEGFKNIQRAAFLGSAPVSALSDMLFIDMAARNAGLPGGKVMRRYFKNMNPSSKSDRQIARQTGFISDSINGMLMGAARWTGDSPIDGRTRRIASVVNRISGLQGMTDAAKFALGMETQGFIARAKMRGVGWDELDELLRDAMESAGLTRSDWDTITRADVFEHEPSGAMFLRTEDVAKIDQDVALKYADFQTKLGLRASNEPTLRSQAITSGAFAGDATAGTPNRAFWSSVTMFKSFPITMMLNHLIPAVRKAATGSPRDLIMLSIGTTILGGVALQTKEILKGREPRDMDDGAFWKAAAMQGGGLGLFGDFMFGEYSRFGRSPITELMGPVAGSASDAARVLMGNFERALDEDRESDFFADLFNFTTRHIPGQNLWYSRLAVERLMFDQMEKLINPNFESDTRAYERRIKDEYGQDFWWDPGEVTPD